MKTPLSKMGGIKDALLELSSFFRNVQYFLQPVLGSETSDPILLRYVSFSLFTSSVYCSLKASMGCFSFELKPLLAYLEYFL